jgi:hypothetical protein
MTHLAPQKLEHRRLDLGVAGRQRQPLALPRGVPNAGGGLVVEEFYRQHYVFINIIPLTLSSSLLL